MTEIAAALSASPVPLDVLALLMALALDLALGEPPNRLHPTVWIGRTVALAERIAPGPESSPPVQLAAGAAMAVVIPGLWGAAAWAAAHGSLLLHPLAYLIVVAALLKTTFSARMLHRVAADIGRILSSGNLNEARQQMSSLVSRDTSRLTVGQMAAGAIESVAENITDSIVGPLLAFALFGLPGAVAYRAINTLDSMIGYHGRYEYLGKVSARLDDFVNLAPARLAAATTLDRHRHSAGPIRRTGVADHAGAPWPYRIAQRGLDDGCHGRRVGRHAREGGPLSPGGSCARTAARAYWHRHARPVRRHRTDGRPGRMGIIWMRWAFWPWW